MQKFVRYCLEINGTVGVFVDEVRPFSTITYKGLLNNKARGNKRCNCKKR